MRGAYGSMSANPANHGAAAYPGPCSTPVHNANHATLDQFRMSGHGAMRGAFSPPFNYGHGGHAESVAGQRRER
jgi:hypothetical protein